MSIYRKVLQEDFFCLHPMLQKRYDCKEGAAFRATGKMKRIKGGPKWLYPLFKLGVRWKLVFPESGQDIPFTIINSAFVNSKGEQQIHWERKFNFPENTRYFNALMSLDEQRMVVKDYLGEPPLLYSDLKFSVLDNGSLKINSLDQRLVLGKFEIPLPRLLQGLAVINESYDEEYAVYRISVEVKNQLIGTVFSYEGVFTADA
ncbi:MULTISPECIES: DUF4166 domain-containing protein [unclassified Sporosarcina]|uniref:DUF4166 domain-containing protein n=1 Tax=unclassified Sporosarcina TaxID=2647733 RepID=UPI00203BD988|nr:MULTISPECIES: DUF4166 domain-containing protein [unclassified Sporosarcina]GKV64723.1 hypothetical protein NCCP2331_08760 [Sporosarcina sp. NCCP-2331]GLB54833.1 hypothetical protein NCCP2378_06180 [Sporosarcina sp. NCCP-2378]